MLRGQQRNYFQNFTSKELTIHWRTKYSVHVHKTQDTRHNSYEDTLLEMQLTGPQGLACTLC